MRMIVINIMMNELMIYEYEFLMIEIKEMIVKLKRYEMKHLIIK